MADNALQRTRDHRGRSVLAMDGLLAGAEAVSGPAAQQDR
jgi:hypothetical protein